MKKKIAFITGITGQDGSFLAEILIKKGYEVHGIKRRSSSLNTSRIDHIYQDPHVKKNKLFLHYGDLLDSSRLHELILKIKPTEVYNLAAQSHVDVSFKMPIYTSDVNGMGTLRLLEAIKSAGLIKKTKFYQASTSELYGKTRNTKQNEETPFYPQSPYSISKLFAYWAVKNYRDSYGMFACNGILFNHESERRGETFVTRKITIGLSRIVMGIDKKIYLGNLYALRDWGHAKDYAYMQWKMLQSKKPLDLVISTGKQYSVKSFIEQCCEYLGIVISWKGKGLKEIGYIKDIKNKKFTKIQKKQIIVQIDKKYFRPSEVDYLLGDSSKAKKLLGWKPKINLKQLIKLMLDEDMKNIKRNLYGEKK
jgi:GDPmannose 4,6-dehydratase